MKAYSYIYTLVHIYTRLHTFAHATLFRYTKEERGFALRRLDTISDEMLLRMFRMSRESFMVLHDRIEPFIPSLTYSTLAQVVLSR